jgi:hypothetical protein
MNGQNVFVPRPSQTIIAKLPAFPDALDLDRFVPYAGMSALCESLVWS